MDKNKKKLDISIPKLDDFIHKIYINVARKIYKNVYLFELGIPPLQTQKHFREIEILVQECILNTIRDSIPIEAILHAYMDETIEEDFTEEIEEKVLENITKKELAQVKPQVISETVQQNKDVVEHKLESDTISSIIHQHNLEAQLDFPELNDTSTSSTSSTSNKSTTLSFSDLDYTVDTNNNKNTIDAPKNIERLEEISMARNAQRKIDEADDDDDDKVKLNISGQDIVLDSLDIHNIGGFGSSELKMQDDLKLSNDFLLGDIEILT